MQTVPRALTLSGMRRQQSQQLQGDLCAMQHPTRKSLHNWMETGRARLDRPGGDCLSILHAQRRSLLPFPTDSAYCTSQPPGTLHTALHPPQASGGVQCGKGRFE